MFLNRISILILIEYLVSQVLGQTTCKNGLGRVLYERLPNQQLQGYDDDVVRDTAPPFRVLEKCQDLCLRDRTGSNNLVRTCTSFDFQPGSRITAFAGNTEYEESLCYLTAEQAGPEGIGNLMLVPNSVHFNEICLTSNRPERECPSRRYVFERHPRKKLKMPISDIKEITAANRSDCEDKCLNEYSFVCRSANFDSTKRSCSLSRFTRRTHPELLEDDLNSDYLENTCLNAERRCDGLAVFVKEENKRLGGPFEVDIFNNMTLEECQTMCLRAEKYFCRSVEFDDQSKQCILSEEDSISQKDDISISSSPTHHFYDLVCLDNQRATDYPDNSITSHLFSSGRRPDTAFQRYRNSRLGGEFHSEITGRSLSECLDECLRQTSFQCRSAVYSDRFRTCRLSRYNQKDGMRIIYDADYDYYENLMLNVMNVNNESDVPSGGTNSNSNNNHHQAPERPNTSNWRTPHRDRDEDRYKNTQYGQGVNQGQGQNHGQGGGAAAAHGPSDYHRQPFNYHPDSDFGGYERYPGPGWHLDQPRDRYPFGHPPLYDDDRYSMGVDHYRYPIDGYINNRNNNLPNRNGYTPLNRDRYYFPYNERYPELNSGRYPYDNRMPPRDRYAERHPDMNLDDRRHSMHHNYLPYRPIPGDYMPIEGNKYPNDINYGRPYASERPSQHIPAQHLYMRDGGYSSNYYGRYPYRYAIPNGEPINDYTGRDAADALYPDRRLRPSSYDSRYPLLTDNGRNRRPDVRPTADELIHNARRPEPDSAKRYPPAPLIPQINKYPPAPNRSPLGKERYPINKYNYGNQYNGFLLGSSKTGYGHPAQTPPYAIDYDERYSDGDRYSPYDRNYDRSLFRRPIQPPGYPGHQSYPSPFNHPYPGSLISPAPNNNPYGLTGKRPNLPPNYERPGEGLPGPPAHATGSITHPSVTRCEESDNFRQIAARHKMRRHFIRKALVVPSLIQCERVCVENRDFICRSFNYRDTAASNFEERNEPNCELSDRDSRELDVHDPNLFDAANYDFYERTIGRSDGECMDVTQTCNEEGMEFTIRTPEGFVGRIYTYGYYDRCFFRGNGGTVNILRISGPQGYPDCGTQRYGDTLTNIVVVQFSDNVQTSRDKRYNLTCVFRSTGEAVVTSGYIGAGSGSPIPIEYLPAENNLSSKVRLSILYQGRPTTTIAVGDPLTFRLEALDGYSHATDIFATNILARDPYSGRSIQLIDRFGCPVDPYVFPELDKSRDGDTLEARFNAFKIPESNFLVFEATVRTCREGCQPAYCPGPSGRQEPSFGKRRRRSLNITETITTTTLINKDEHLEEVNEVGTQPNAEPLIGEETYVDNTTTTVVIPEEAEDLQLEDSEHPEQVREMIEVRVFESREEIEKESYPRKLIAPATNVCLTPSEYYGLLSAIILLLMFLLSIALISGLFYRRYWQGLSKNHLVEHHSPLHSLVDSAVRQHGRFNDIGCRLPGNSAVIVNSGAHKTNSSRSSSSIFVGSLNKTFATGNLARMCQMPVISTVRNNHCNHHQFEDPSEPIYTDPSLFEHSRSLRSLDLENTNGIDDGNNNHSNEHYR